MKKNASKIENIDSSIFQWGATILFGVVTLLFWKFMHPELLSHHEEAQLFVFDLNYAKERLLLFGGLSVYLGEFITQFFSSLWLGSLLMALMLTSIQRLTWIITSKSKSSTVHYQLSFIPSIVIIIHLSNGNVMISYVVSVIIALISIWLYTVLKSNATKNLYVGIMIPILFTLISSGEYIFVLSIALMRFTQDKNKLSACIFTVLAVLYTIATVIVSYRLSSYELWRVAIGLYQYRVKSLIEWSNFNVAALVAAMPILISFVGSFNYKNIKSIVFIESVILIIGASTAIAIRYDSVVNEQIKYEYLVRTRQWDKIIDIASKHQNETVYETLSLNLALASTGQLAERIFEFKQHGPDGLIPPFPKDNATITLAAEIYLRIGLINIAQRTFFEAQENIMTDVKSGRLSMCLAEISIINGEYKIAKKYIDLLKKTYTYRNWAKATELLLNDEEKINSHPYYGEMRRMKVNNDIFYSENILDQIAQYHFEFYPNNRTALEYALCYLMLKGKSNDFVHSFKTTLKKARYLNIPKSYQEALAYDWRIKNKSFDKFPWKTSPAVLNQYDSFVAIYASDKNDKRLSTPPLCQTYWRYLSNK